MPCLQKVFHQLLQVVYLVFRETETQSVSRKTNKLVSLFYIVLLLMFFGTLNSLYAYHRQTSKKHNTDDFYQTIIDNNIFRPLGWRLKKPPFPYRLISTITYTKGNRKPTAIIQENDAQKTIHTVTIGATLGDTTVVDIQSKQVTLDQAGKKITLNIGTMFLNTPRTVARRTQENTKKQQHKKITGKTTHDPKKASPNRMPVIHVDPKQNYGNPSNQRITFKF